VIFRVDATNHLSEQLTLEQAAAASRDEYLVERTFSRLKGRPLSLAPLYVQHAVLLYRGFHDSTREESRQLYCLVAGQVSRRVPAIVRGVSLSSGYVVSGMIPTSWQYTHIREISPRSSARAAKLNQFLT
jgi:hypothetical protein